MTELCNEVKNAIALEGKAPENEEFRKHLSECTGCARFLRNLLAVESELGGLVTHDASDDIVEKLLARPELSAKAASHRTLYWAMGLAAAATIAFVAARVTLTGYSSFSREYEIDAHGDVKTSQSEGDELSSEERERLDSLGDVGGYDYADVADDQLDGNATTRDKVIRREEQVENQEKRRARIRELNERGYFRPLEDDDELENKNESLKKDNEAGGRFAKSGSVSGNRVASTPAAAEPVLEDARAHERASRTAGRSQASPLAQAPLSSSVDESEMVANQPAPLEGIHALVREADPADEDDVAEFKSQVILRGEVDEYGNYQREAEPRKLVHVDAVYPEAAKQKRPSGTVVLRALIDRGGNVTRAIVLESVGPLDQAAIDCVLQWKYEASDRDERTVTVRIAFEAAPQTDADARLFLEERERIDNLLFRDARGYWANTYLPGDPKARFLAMRLRNAHQLVAPHVAARPVVQPFDAPRRGALSLTLHADHRGISEPSRLLVQVGLQATESHGRRRPPMNVGIVLDAKPNDLAATRALIDSLQQARALGDRFRLILPGKGEIVPPESFRHGPLSVALDELEASNDLEGAVRLAIEHVHAGDDPTMPLGSSLVLVVTPRKLGDELDALSRLAHRSAVGGVPVSVIGVGASVDRSELERLALAGQGRRYFLEQAQDANGIVDRELAASSRVVARALRLRIKLADGVKLVDVIGSVSLNERQAERVREAEKSIDLRLSRNLGIDADRGEDEDGIQIVIPSFYAGDAHTILLDVVAARPGPIAEVTVRYKDLAELRNTVARASLALPRSSSGDIDNINNINRGPLETNVLKNYLAFHLSEVLEGAADKLEQGDRSGAIDELDEVRRLLAGLPFGSDGEIARDVAMLSEYVSILSSSVEPALVAYLADSLRYASASKRRLPAALI